ncbi:unnamed protein product, partial [marine sediment metagenome]
MDSTIPLLAERSTTREEIGTIREDIEDNIVPSREIELEFCVSDNPISNHSCITEFKEKITGVETLAFESFETCGVVYELESNAGFIAKVASPPHFGE